MAKQYVWHSKMAINVLNAGRAEADPGCKNLNSVTRAVLAQVRSGGNAPKELMGHLSRYVSEDLLFGRGAWWYRFLAWHLLSVRIPTLAWDGAYADSRAQGLHCWPLQVWSLGPLLQDLQCAAW